MSIQSAHPVIEVFSRPGCHLCEVLLDELQPLVRGVLEVAVRNIDGRDDWRTAYGELIPVVVFEGREVCRYRLDQDAIIRLVADCRATDSVLLR